MTYDTLWMIRRDLVIIICYEQTDIYTYIHKNIYTHVHTPIHIYYCTYRYIAVYIHPVGV